MRYVKDTLTRLGCDAVSIIEAVADGKLEKSYSILNKHPKTTKKNRLYMVALNTALTLPDICGKAKYPTLKTVERYKKWYDEYV